MSLIECSECRQQISDFAYFCPKCGHIKKHVWLENTGKVYKTISYLIGFLSGLFYFVSYKPRLFSSSFVELANTLKIVTSVLSIMFFVVGVVSWKIKVITD